MGLHIVRLPDVGEGIAEAELVEWHVALGDHVAPDAHLADVLTDKATIEISSPVAGVISFLGGEPGDLLAIGSDFVGIDVDGAGNAAGQRRSTAAPTVVEQLAPPAELSLPSVSQQTPGSGQRGDTDQRDSGAAESVSQQTPDSDQRGDTDPSLETASTASTASTAPTASTAEPSRVVPSRIVPVKPVAAPAVRLRAGDLGVDLRQVRGTGPANRITHADLDLFVTGGVAATRQSSAASALGAVTETKIVGLRRKIAEQMSRSASRIPHITYVDEVDLAGVESLRAALNDGTRTKLTLLPFVIRALVRAIAEQPHLNSTFDDESGVLSTFADVNVGIATQTSNGLIVPVVRNAGRRSVWATAAEIARVSEAARTGTATRDDLNGSTITITSLGALGGLVTTPIINHPEVAIIGINKIQIRPVWDTDHFVPKPMMNLSSSFDHRIVDGFDAATFIQRIKALLETPALLFIGGDGDELIDGDGERNSKDSG